MDLIMSSTRQLAGWIPIRLYWKREEPMVDWCDLGDLRFTDPFFDQTIGHAMRNPFNAVFRHQTSVRALESLSFENPGLAPAGFIFHMSRCGSTLISQMLAANSRSIVISEAGPVDFALRARPQGKAISDDERVRWLQWLVGAFGQRRAGENYFFIKFDSWHVLQLPLLRRAFPNVPWIFLYRDPVEVLVSHRNQPGAQMVPGMLNPALFGVDPATLGGMRQEEYGATVLAAILEAAATHAKGTAARLINYTELPEIAWSSLLNHFGVTFSDSEIERMKSAARVHAKNPTQMFEADSAEKKAKAGDLLREISDRRLRPHYERLEAMRVGTTSGGHGQ
jgi:gluconate kinase